MDTPDIMPRETEVTITLYSQPGCVQCNAEKKKLEKEDAEFTVVDVSLPENEGDLLAMKELGYLKVPVTFVNDEHFGGYDINRVMDAVARQRRTKMHVVEDLVAV